MTKLNYLINLSEKLDFTESSQFLSYNNILKIEENCKENVKDNLLYNIHNLEELVTLKFYDSEKDNYINFSVIIELEREPNEEEINRKDELTADIKMYKKLVKLVKDNVENNKFYDVYKIIKQLLISETAICIEVLNAKSQQ
ncbi:16293_t:CDS:2 [Cetraspora pellucida]|uniref:16293_t:CDS:1 n=1 Tax=Cetraspora pellucida TaxID=1433469 RepID=A0ACA9KAJ4_9GLOM|nr:16293_t:CDS:2 [Cetraspora pellucida]